MATFRLRSVRKRERGRKGKNGVVEKQRRKKSPHENPSDSSQEKAAQSRLRATPLSDTRTSISRASFSNSLNSTERRNFANFSKRPRGVGWVILEEKTIRKDSRGEERERQGRLLNEINEKQRSAGGFNPL